MMQKRYPSLPPWLDDETRLLVDEMLDLLVERHRDILAIILYGSIARHEERALDEPYPSDVDILIVVDTKDREGIRAQEESLFETLGLAKTHHLQAEREVNVMFSSRTSQEWDSTFIDNVKHDGIILYQRGALPAAFVAEPDKEDIVPKL
jgi:predicted nucleotidyltransferase